MKKIMSRMIFVLLAIAFIAQTPTPAKTSLAIYQIRAKGTADPSLGSAMTALLSSRLTPSPRLRVIEDAMLKTVMERQAMNISDACDDTSCQVEIGKLVQAQKLIAGDLVKLGSKYILSLKLIDVQSGANEFSTEDQCACSEDQLDQLVELAGVRVRNHFGENLPLPALAQAGAAPPAAPPAPGPTTAPAPPPKFKPLPGPRSPNNAVFYIGGDCSKAPAGNMRMFKFILDGQSLGKFGKTNCIRKELTPGKHTLAVKLMGVTASSYDISFAPGQKAFMNLCTPQGQLAPEVVPEEQAVSWAQDCEESSSP
jgi:hypothetical protein